MFIDLTRHGGGRVLRVAVAAIAYLDACEGGTAVHLVGGETLRVIEDAATIEERATPQFATAELVAQPAITADVIVDAYRRIAADRSAEEEAHRSAYRDRCLSTPPSEVSPEPTSGKRPVLKAHR